MSIPNLDATGKVVIVTGASKGLGRAMALGFAEAGADVVVASRKLAACEVVAAEIFWGLWLFPLGVLAYRSRFLPRFLGVWLVINGFAYLAMSFTGLLLPQYEDMVSNIAFPAQLGELAFMWWLVIKGAKPQPLGAAASSLAVG